VQLFRIQLNARRFVKALDRKAVEAIARILLPRRATTGILPPMTKGMTAITAICITR